MTDPFPSASQGKVIVITGATGGLGIATAQAFAERGHSLVLLDRHQQRLNTLREDLRLPEDRLLIAALDLQDRDAIRALAESVSVKFGGAHALIHLVGGWLGGKTLVESSVEDLDSMLRQHVWSTFHLFQAFIPQLVKHGWGRVLTVSPSTVSNPPARRGPYLAAKAAQENLILTLIAELKEQGVTANILQVRAIDEERKGTGTTPEEIVAAMLYLFSEEAAKVNGARIPLY